MLVARDGVEPHQHPAVLVPVDVLQKLALAAAGGPLVHHHHLVFIGGDDPGGGGVGGDPALVLPDVQQDAVHALLGGGAGIEVVGKDLVEVLAPAVDHHLLAVEVGVAEGGRHVHHGPGLELLLLPDVQKRLELGQGEGEEGGVAGAHQHGGIAVLIPARLEGHQDELLGGQPIEGLLPQVGERVAVHLVELGLVGGEVVGHPHAVRVPAAHVVLGEVHHRAVFAADHIGLPHGLALHVVEHLDAVGALVAEDELEQGLLALRDDDAGALLDHRFQLLREDEAVQ